MRRFYAPRVPEAPSVGMNDARSAAVNWNVPQPNVAGAALDAGAKTVGTLEKKVYADELNRDNIEAIKRENQFAMGATDALSKLNTLDPQYSKQVEETLSSLRSEASDPSAFIHSESADAFNARMEKMQGNLALQAMDQRRSDVATEAVRVRKTEQDGTLGLIRANPQNAPVYLQQFAQKKAVLDAAIPGHLVPALDSRFHGDVLTAQAEGLANQEHYAEARKLLDDNQGAMAPEAYRNGKRLIKEIENGKKQEFLSGTAAQIADLEIKIDRAPNTSSLDALERQVRSFDKMGLFQGREQTKVRLMRQIQSGREKIQKDGADLTAGLTEYNAGLGISSKKRASAVWGSLVPNIDTNDPEAVASAASNFAKRSGWVPPPIADRFQTAEHTDSPQLLAQATAMHDRIRAENPDAQGLKSGGDRIALTSAYAELMKVPYDKAAEIVINRVPDQATVKARDEQFNVDFKSEVDPQTRRFNAPAMIEDELGVDAKYVTPEAARAYERRLRLMYRLTGNPDVAKKAAARTFQQEWGKTDVGGNSRLVRTPPERYFPDASNTNLDAEQKTEILDAEVSRSLVQHGITPGIVTGSEKKAGASGAVPAELQAEAVATQNLGAATRELNMTEQERNLYKFHLHNLTTAPVINKDGSVSTLLQISFEANGRFYNAPTVWDGQKHTPDEAVARAKEIGLKNFPSYKTEKEAEARYQAMHTYMERDVQQGVQRVPQFSDASGVPPYSLTSDAQTERELAAGIRPSYTINARNSLGILVPTGLRYVMPTMQELQQVPEYQRMREAAMAPARARQQAVTQPSALGAKTTDYGEGLLGKLQRRSRAIWPHGTAEPAGPGGIEAMKKLFGGK